MVASLFFFRGKKTTRLNSVVWGKLRESGWADVSQQQSISRSADVPHPSPDLTRPPPASVCRTCVSLPAPSFRLSQSCVPSGRLAFQCPIGLTFAQKHCGPQAYRVMDLESSNFHSSILRHLSSQILQPPRSHEAFNINLSITSAHHPDDLNHNALPR